MQQEKNSRLVDFLLVLPRPWKRAIALGADALICWLSVYLAFYLRLGNFVDPFAAASHPTMGAVAIALPIFVALGLYRAIFRHAGFEALVVVGRAVSLYLIPFALIYTVIGVSGVPRTIGLIQPMLLFLFVSSSRLLTRAYLGKAYRVLWSAEEAPRVLIYGAGRAGRQLASAIRVSGEMRLMGFIDDDPNLWQSTINGTNVYSPDKLEALVKRGKVGDILLAIPSTSRRRRTEIVEKLRPLKLHVRILPGLTDLARGSVSIQDLRELAIEDLLGRNSVPPDLALIRRNVAGKVVMVTGAGGSIGSELCRQILAVAPERLVLFESAEFSLYAIHQELVASASAVGFSPSAIIPILGSITDQRRVDEVIGEFAPDTVFHAAAYKQVPLVEYNVTQGITNNVFGTLNLARAAQRHGVPSFTLISTDKAVRPTNFMGTTKRLAEMVLQAIASEGGTTRFSMVRFGNVLGSSGSVVPLFRDQIARGGPVTITDERITRFFMTIPEAAQLVIQAGAMSTGGEVFLLDMGEPVRIVDLARNMVELSGLTLRDAENTGGDIAIEMIGLRPGEKLYEELLIGDKPLHTEHPRIMRSREDFLRWPDLQAGLNDLEQALAANDVARARSALIQLVPEFQPQSPIVDLVACEKAARMTGPESSPADATSSAESGTGASIHSIGLGQHNRS